MAITVRPLAAQDREAWERLWTGYLAFYEHAPTSDKVDGLWGRLMRDVPDLHCLVAHDSTGEIVGIVQFLYHPSTLDLRDKCYLQDLFVDPDRRTNGAGRALIEAVYAAAKAYGAYEVYWTTQTYNSVARVLYDRIGDLTPFIKYRKGIN